MGANTSNECRDDCTFAHDEADVTMISYIKKASELGKAVVRILGEDTDVFVMLACWVWHMQLHRKCNVQMERWNGDVVDINATTLLLGSKCLQLLGMHALSGCDTVSYPFNNRKISALNVLKSGDFPGLFEVLGEKDATDDDLMETGQRFFAAMYDFHGVPRKVGPVFRHRRKVVIVVFVCFVAYWLYHDTGSSSSTLKYVVNQIISTKDRHPVHSYMNSANPDNAGPASQSYSSVELETAYEQRQKAVEAACKKAGRPVPKALSNSAIPKNFIVEPINTIIYCPIEKVGSTFWKRTLTTMNRAGNMSSPFSINLEGTKPIRYNHFQRQQSEDGMNNFLKNATAFLFTRDPYSRLFSAYVNKLFCPNWYYWVHLGRPIIKTVRKTNSQTFGNDVTFAELIKYTLMLYEKQKNYIDIHFKPMNEICDPCSIPFDFFGQMKTFKDDALYLLGKWKKEKGTYVHIDDFEKETALDSARSQLVLTFEVHKKLLETTTFPLYTLLLRVWRDMQIRGMLPVTVDMPLTTDEAGNATHDSVMELMKRTLDKPANRTRLAVQREEAMVQAYQSVPLGDMEKLRNFVKMDCDLFGFDDRPSKLFDRNESVITAENQFRYFR